MIPIASPYIEQKEKQNVIDVLSSGIFVNGTNVKLFGEKFKEYIGVNWGIPTSSGTTALHSALLAAGIKRGDEVIVPSFTFFATASAVYWCGARPVFVDCNDTFEMNINDVANSITKKTRAIIPVHLFGEVNRNIEFIKEICDEYKLWMIEDACQAHGAEYKGKKAGSLGDIAAFSFYPTKNMTVGGDGGMVVTNNDRIAAKVSRIINHGQVDKYIHIAIGCNYRMSEVSAAIGLGQLSRLDDMNARRIINAEYYHRNLPDTGMKKPIQSENIKHVYNQYTLLLDYDFPMSRDDFVIYLNKHNIGTGVHYPVPLNHQPAFVELCGSEIKNKCPNAYEISNRVVSIPVHPRVKVKDLEYICKIIGEIV